MSYFSADAFGYMLACLSVDLATHPLRQCTEGGSWFEFVAMMRGEGGLLLPNKGLCLATKSKRAA